MEIVYLEAGYVMDGMTVRTTVMKKDVVHVRDVQRHNIVMHVVIEFAIRVYLTSPGPSEIGHNSFIPQPILKPLRPVDSS